MQEPVGTVGHEPVRKAKAASSCDIKGGQTPVKYKEVLRLLEDQQFRCALTGRKLVPGEAALDHIFPVSRGGKHCMENAQILRKEVNRAKNTMTNEEFIAMCREVVALADGDLTSADEG